jgi:hypothetical protein
VERQKKIKTAVNKAKAEIKARAKAARAEAK